MKKFSKVLFSFFILFNLILIPSSSFAQTGDIDPNPTTEECISLENNLRYRDRDATKNGEVSLLQDFLQSKGYLNTEPTGYFGILTFKAVKNFQRDNGINPTGYVGSITRAKIVNLTCTLGDPLIPPVPNTSQSQQSPQIQTTLKTSTTTIPNTSPTTIKILNSTLIKDMKPFFLQEMQIPISSNTNNTREVCENRSDSWIKVLSPSNGDKYEDGQKITIRWESCGIPINNQTEAILNIYDKNDVYLKSLWLGYSSAVLTSSGYMIAELPAFSLIKRYPEFKNAIFGQHFGVSLISYDPITGAGVINTSKGRFSINASTTRPYVTILSPNGGEVYSLDDIVRIKWDSKKADKIYLAYTFDDSDLTEFTRNIPNTGYYDWKVNIGDVFLPAKVKIYIFASRIDLSEVEEFDASDNFFTVDGLMPIFQLGDVNGDGKIDCTDISFIRQAVNGSRTLTAKQKSRADINSDGNITDSDIELLIQKHNLNYCITTGQPSVILLSPNGKEIYTIGQEVVFKWSSNNLSTQLFNTSIYIQNTNTKVITYLRDNGGRESIQNDGSEIFILPNDLIAGNYTATVVIMGIDNFLAAQDSSDNLFTINPATPTLQLGDVNGDGKIDCTDVSWIRETVLLSRTLTAEQKKRADMNGDGIVTTYDALLLSQKYNLNCGTTEEPVITIISPNGGESYLYTDTFPYRYKLTYRNSGTTLLSLVQNPSVSNPGLKYDIGGGMGPNNQTDYIVYGNVGVLNHMYNFESIVVPGKYYLMVSYKSNDGLVNLTDFSDNYFTINNRTIHPTTTPTPVPDPVPPPVSGFTPTNTTLDPTPRIAYWGGKVGQHTDREGNWLSDPDGTSGVVETDAGRLAYCKKWFGNITSAVQYKTETITTWKRSKYANDPSSYTNTVLTYKCINGSPISKLNKSASDLSLSANALSTLDRTNTQIAPKALSETPVLACTSFTKILMKGMNDNEVKCLQQKLNEKGYKIEGIEKDEETTYFGYYTQSALKAFQLKNNLKADGIFGTQTRGLFK